jgi:hypothetical protein
MMALPAVYKPAVLLGVSAAAALASFGAGWAVNGWRLGARVAECRAESSKRDAEADRAALYAVQQAATAVQDAASAAAASGARMAAANDEARRQWAVLVKRAPLPAGCEPGPERAQAMREALQRTREQMK